MVMRSGAANVVEVKSGQTNSEPANFRAHAFVGFILPAGISGTVTFEAQKRDGTTWAPIFIDGAAAECDGSDTSWTNVPEQVTGYATVRFVLPSAPGADAVIETNTAN